MIKTLPYHIDRRSLLATNNSNTPAMLNRVLEPRPLRKTQHDVSMWHFVSAAVHAELCSLRKKPHISRINFYVGYESDMMLKH